MEQQLRALTALVQDPPLVSSIHMLLTTVWGIHSGFHKLLNTHGIHKLMQACIHADKKQQQPP